VFVKVFGSPEVSYAFLLETYHCGTRTPSASVRSQLGEGMPRGAGSIETGGS